MESYIWGPTAWHFLHTMSYMSPEKISKAYFNTLYSLKYILPCRVCRNHYSKNYKKFPCKARTRNDLVLWLINFHNLVNKMLDKPELSVDQVNSLYLRGNKLLVDHSKIIKFCDVLMMFFHKNTCKQCPGGYKMFFLSLGETFPCLYCRKRFKELINKIPYDEFNPVGWWRQFRDQFIHHSKMPRKVVLINILNTKKTILDNIIQENYYIYIPKKKYTDIRYDNHFIYLINRLGKEKKLRITKDTTIINNASLMYPVDVHFFIRKRFPKAILPKI